MTAPPPRRPWWRRKRTWAALALWLVVAYPLTAGPVLYGVWRGWPVGVMWNLFDPLARPSFTDGPLGETYGRYLLWWANLAASD